MTDPAVLMCYCHLPCKCAGITLGTYDHQAPGHVHVSDIRLLLGLPELPPSEAHSTGKQEEMK